MMAIEKDFIESLPNLCSSRNMSKNDRAAVDFGIPSMLLMEKAANEALATLQYCQSSLANKIIWLFMGSGGNGGDAACMARHLHEYGGLPVLFHLKQPQDYRGDCAFNLDLALKDKVPTLLLSSTKPDELAKSWLQASAIHGRFPHVIIDGLLGTGFNGCLNEVMTDLIEEINKLARMCQAFVLALDIPSGLNADSGLPSPIAIKANATVSFAAAKPGQILSSSRPYSGKIFIRNIGFPHSLHMEFNAKLLTGSALLDDAQLPANSFKNIFGHVLIYGGSEVYTGAPKLSAIASLRTGAGLVSVCSEKNCLDRIKADTPEIMTVPLPENLSQAVLETGATSLVIGPGLGRTPGIAQRLAQILEIPDRPPAVIDADAIWHISRNKSLKGYITEKDILTPHPGEAAMLLDCAGKDIQADRLAALAELTRLFPAAIVLKGADCLLGQRTRKPVLCPYDIPQLAFGGAGDVLSGCLGALLGYKAKIRPSSLSFAARGVILHTVAALALAREYPDRGFLASELASALATARKYLKNLPKEDLKAGLCPWPA